MGATVSNWAKIIQTQDKIYMNAAEMCVFSNKYDQVMPPKRQFQIIPSWASIFSFTVTIHAMDFIVISF